MNRPPPVALAVAAAVALIILANTFFVVDQRKQAVVVRFGEAVRVVNATPDDGPGLKVKIPFLENKIVFDKRNVSLEAPQAEIISADQQRLVVDAYVRYRITDPLQFYRAVRDERTAADRLQRLVNSSIRQVLGAASSEAIVSGRRAELMLLARNDVAKRARDSRLGVEVVDVRIKRADLPQANQAAVFRRMQTSRQLEAAQIRAQGEQQKRTIMATADKEVAITLATATEEAEKTRGEGDGRRAAIFAASFGQDPGFAAFYRSMQAYEASFGQGDTTLVLSPDSEFFRYFDRGATGR